MATSPSEIMKKNGEDSTSELPEDEIVAIGFALLCRRQESLGRYGQIRILESKDEGEEG